MLQKLHRGFNEVKSRAATIYRRAINVAKVQSGRNALFTASATVLTPICQLVSVPIVIKGLGAELFGCWSLLNAILAVSGIANLGIGEATTKFVAQYHAQGDPQKTIRLIQNSIVLFLLFGIVVGLSIWFSAPWLAEVVFKANSTNSIQIVTALRIASVGVLVRFVYGVLEATVRGFHRYDKEAIWAGFNSLSSIVLSMIFVSLGYKLVALVYIGILTLSISCVGVAFAVRNLTGDWSFLRLGVERALVKEIFGFGMFAWFQTVNGIVLHQLDRIIIGATLGPSTVGIYSICLNIVQTAHSVLARGSAFLFPLIVKLRAENKVSEVRSIQIRGMHYTTLLGWLMASILIIFGYDILSTWLDESIAEKAIKILVVLALWNACLATAVVPYYILNASGYERLNAVFGALSSGLFAILALWLVPNLGANGAALARLGSVSTGIFSRRIMFDRLFGDRRWFVSLLPFLPVIAGAAISLLPSYIIEHEHNGHYIPKTLCLLFSILACHFVSKTVYFKVIVRFEASKSA